MKRILVAKDVAYANNKAGDGANSATNPVDLLDGAIGIYGIPKTSANNANKLALIIDGGTDAAGKVPDSAFDGERIVVAVGTASGGREGNPIDLGPLQDIKISAAAYVAPTAGKTIVGYDGGVGKLNLPTAAAGDNIGITVKRDEGNDQPIIETRSWSVIYGGGESNFSAISRLLADMYDDGWVSVKLLHNGSGSAFTDGATTPTVAVTNGSVTATASAAHGVDVGDFISLNGDLYQAITGSSATVLILNRPYGGATGTIANNQTLDLGASAPSELGIEVTSREVNKNFIVSAFGNLEYADAAVTAPSQGTGTPDLIKEIEDKWAGWLGTTSKADGTIPYPANLTDGSSSYAIYTFSYKNAAHPDGNNRVTDVRNELVVVFPGNSNGAQAEFEDVMGVLINGADGIGGLA